MEVRPIRTEKDHKAALAEIEACWGAPEGSEEGDRLDVLLALAEIYEAKRWPIETAKRFDPIDVLNYAIDELGQSQAELKAAQCHGGNGHSECSLRNSANRRESPIWARATSRIGRKTVGFWQNEPKILQSFQ